MSHIKIEIMKVSQRSIAVGFIIFLNISSLLVLAGPGILFSGSYSPPLVVGWQNFESHYSISSFSFDSDSFSNFDSFYLSIHLLKNELPLTIDINNGTNQNRFTITDNFTSTLMAKSSFYIDALYAESLVSELELTLIGNTNSIQTELINSSFLRFGRIDDLHLRFQYSGSENDDLYIDLFMNISEINGSGKMFIGQGNELGDYYIKPKLTIPSPGNYSTSLKISYQSIPFSNTENFVSQDHLNAEEYSSMVWDQQGQYKIIIKSYESNLYIFANILAYFYLFGVLMIDGIVLVFVSVRFLSKKVFPQRKK